MAVRHPAIQPSGQRYSIALAIRRLGRRIAVDVGDGHQTEQTDDSRDGDPGDLRIEVRKQFLEPEEVPRRLGWVGSGVEVSGREKPER